MAPLQNLKMLREEKQLMADLWCHFGKVFVSCVDEGSNIIRIYNNLFVSKK
jgi:hypothetical protein